MEGEILHIKDRIVDKILFSTAVLLTIPYVASMLRFFEMGWNVILTLVNVGFAGIWITFYLRRHLNFRTKVLLLTLLFGSIGILGLLAFGFSGAYYFFFLPVILLGILLGKRQASLYLGFIALAIFLIAWGFLSGRLTPLADLAEQSTRVTVWMTFLVSVLFVALIMLIFTGDLYQYLVDNLVDKDRVVREIRQKQRELQRIFDSAPAIMLVTNSRGEIIKINRAGLDFSRTKQGKVTLVRPGDAFRCFHSVNEGKGCFHTPSCDTCLLRTTLLDTIENQKEHNLVEVVLDQMTGGRPDSRTFLMSTSIIGEKDDIQILVTLDDVTEEKEAEQMLKDQHNALEKVVEERTEDLRSLNEELSAIIEDQDAKNKVIHQQNQELELALENLKATQSKLIQSEKRASMGILTAGVAHEINNPLNFISGGYIGLYNYFQRRGTLEEDLVPEFLDSIRTGLTQATRIIRGMEQFSRNDENRNDACDLHAILDTCLGMLNWQLQEKAAITKEYSDQPLIIPGNMGKLNQTFMNILNNSLQAIPDKGHISIRTESSRDTATVRIEDDGCGIPPEHMSLITDPFFTTREPGKGNGLGLFIAHSVIHEHKGSLNFRSEPGKGTQVTIRLPFSR